MYRVHLRIRVLIILVTLCLIALTVQSYVGMSLAVSTGLKSFIAERTAEFERSATAVAVANEIDRDVLLSFIDKKYYQSLAHGDGSGAIKTAENCVITAAQEKGIGAALKERQTDIRFEGMVFRLFFYRSAACIISVPVQQESGTVQAVSAYISLLPVYDRFQGVSNITLFYILINAILFGTIGYFRIDKYLIRPIQKLVTMAEHYCEDKEISFYPQKNTGPFRVIGLSISLMISRIQRDNVELSTTVEELREANEELRTNRMKMVHSEKLTALGRLSAGLAHEIGNPLSIVQGYVDLLKREGITVEERESFGGKADEELDRIKKLIQEMLNFSRPSKVEVELVELNNLVAEVLQLMNMEKRLKHCEVIPLLRAEKDSISIERDAFKQVLINCILNAADAIDIDGSNRRTITVSTKNKVEEDSQTIFVLTIKDQGRGIKPEDISKVFEPFYTTKAPGQGTGLGLFVSHMLVERIGGVIHVTSDVNRGTVVELEIPLNFSATSH